MELEILYKDNFLVAINKPHGLLVHRSKIARDADVFALQLLRDQIGQHVYPCHRIDRKTAGVLLFALNEEVDKMMKSLFAENKISKIYRCILRGYTAAEEIIDYPLKRDDGKVQEAITKYRTIKHSEVPLQIGKFPTSRYSLVEAYPQTGRMHQLRKHFAHILHPIIGDRPHGCNKQNRFFKQEFSMDTMMLHAQSIQFIHPVTKKEVIIEAKASAEFVRVQQLLEL